MNDYLFMFIFSIGMVCAILLGALLSIPILDFFYGKNKPEWEKEFKK